MAKRGEGIVKTVFGGSLYQQGRGFYVTLELLAILRGSLLLEKATESDCWVLPSSERKTSFLRPTHDFARRLMAGYFERTDPERLASTMDKEAADALRKLLLGLHVSVPGRRGQPANWRKWHLYPYPPDFIHYDALQRGRRISIERDSYRGGGGLAHRILREDANRERLAETRSHFRTLLENASSPLGALARALGNLDEARDEAREQWTDVVESESTVKQSPWVEQLRSGVHRIVKREDLPESKRFETLMHWVPFCLARHQQSLAYGALGEAEDGQAPRFTVFDCQLHNNPIRDLARRAFQESNQAVAKALEAEAKRQSREDLLAGNKGWMTSPRTFFTTTMYAVGAANAPGGIRWFTIQPELLEAIVVAKVDGAISFDRLCNEVLYRQLGMVVDRRSAFELGILDIDQSTFENNSEGLAEQLAELGFLERYSDMTRMVGVRA